MMMNLKNWENILKQIQFKPIGLNSHKKFAQKINWAKQPKYEYPHPSPRPSRYKATAAQSFWENNGGEEEVEFVLI